MIIINYKYIFVIVLKPKIFFFHAKLIWYFDILIFMTLIFFFLKLKFQEEEDRENFLLLLKYL